MRHTLVSIALVSLVTADVSFTSPSAGENIPAGTIQVQWQESGLQPLISELSGYTLSLMTGGNDDGNMLPLTQFVSQGDFSNGYEAHGTIPAADHEVQLFRVVSTAEQGGTVINFSSRFNITGLSGATPLQYRQAAESLQGATAGPGRIVNVAGLNTTNTTSQLPATSSNDTDTSASAHATTVASISSSASTTSSSGQSLSSTSSAAAAPDAHGLSIGNIAGIIIGCSLAGLALVAAFVAGMFFRRRRRQQSANANSNSAFLDDKAELCADEPEPRSPSASELGTEHEVVEADDGLRPPELDPTSVRAELAEMDL